MSYQELKLRDAFRLGVFSLVATAVILFLWYRPELADALAEMRRPNSNGGGMAIVVGLAIVIAVCWGIVIWDLISSPAQDARYIAKREAKGKPPMGRFDPSLINPSDPYFETPTIRYLFNKLRSVQ